MNRTAIAALVLVPLAVAVMIMMFSVMLSDRGSDANLFEGQITLDADAEAEIAALSLIVAELRGLPWITEPDVIVLNPAAFDQMLTPPLSLADASASAESHLYRALGQLDADTTLDAVNRSFATDAIDGVYHPALDALVLNGDSMGPYARVVIVHELAHALEAQHYDFSELLDVTDPDKVIAHRGLIEGSATVVEEAFVAQMSPSEAAAYDAAVERRVERSPGIAELPSVYLATQGAPYGAGSSFVEALIDHSGESAIAEAYDHPPATSSHLLHPELYIAGAETERVALADPEVEATYAGGGVFGEVRLLGLLASTEDAAVASWAEGWVGDRYATWTDGANSCVRINTELVSTQDAGELLEGAQRWAEGQPDAEVTKTADTQVSIRSCELA